MISLPIYAFITNLFTIIVLFAIKQERTTKLIIYLIGISIACYFISLLILSDYLIYELIFNSINVQQSFAEQRESLYGEFLYLYLNYLSKFFTDNFNYLRVVIIFFSLLIKLIFAIRWSKYISVVFIFYLGFLFYPDSYMLRSTLASTFILLAISSLIDKSYIKFSFFNILAIGFHASAIIAFIFPLLFKFNIEKNRYFIFLFILISSQIGLGGLTVQIFSYLLNGDQFYANQLITYSASVYGESVGIFRLSVLIYTAITFMYIFYFKAISLRFENSYKVILCAQLLALLFLIGYSDIGILADRLFRLFCFIFPVALGQILYSLKRSHIVIASVSIIGISNTYAYLPFYELYFL